MPLETPLAEVVKETVEVSPPTVKRAPVTSALSFCFPGMLNTPYAVPSAPSSGSFPELVTVTAIVGLVMEASNPL